MRGQSLSIQTIAIIVIALIVLAGIAIFFFVYMGKGKTLVGKQTNYSQEKVSCVSLQSCVYTKNPANCQDISSKCQLPSTTCKVYLNDGTECECSSGGCNNA